MGFVGDHAQIGALTLTVARRAGTQVHIATSHCPGVSPSGPLTLHPGSPTLWPLPWTLSWAPSPPLVLPSWTPFMTVPGWLTPVLPHDDDGATIVKAVASESGLEVSGCMWLIPSAFIDLGLVDLLCHNGEGLHDWQEANQYTSSLPKATLPTALTTSSPLGSASPSSGTSVATWSMYPSVITMTSMVPLTRTHWPPCHTWGPPLGPRLSLTSTCCPHTPTACAWASQSCFFFLFLFFVCFEKLVKLSLKLISKGKGPRIA